MDALIIGLSSVLAIVRPLALVAAVIVGGAALASWATATRRISPFGAIARFTRQKIDPFFQPAEKRLLLMGGQPSHAPWWTLAAVVVGGLVVISLLQFVLRELLEARAAVSFGSRGIVRLIVTWLFAVLKVAIMARVISSWVGGSRYSKWWRWAFTLTDPFMEPLRRVLPTFGPIDVSPIVAYFGVVLLQGLVMGVL